MSAEWMRVMVDTEALRVVTIWVVSTVVSRL
jgi:hypothetical protein